MVGRYKANTPELEANAFAAELLMPRTLFRGRVGAAVPSQALIKDLAEHFGTTLSATVVRFVEVEDEACAFVVTENGRVRWWKANDRFDGYWLDPDSEVSPHTVAGAYLSGESFPDEAEQVDGEAWLGGRARRVAESLYEVAIPLGRYGVVSIVWPA